MKRMARGKQKADHRADNRGGPWAGLPHVVLDSLAYRHLSLWGRAVLIEIVRTMNGYNNGEIGISQRQLAERLHTSNFKQIGRAIAELMAHGFLDIVIEGRWKQGKAREYRLTFVNTGSPGHYKAATNEYRDWQPRAKSGAEPVSANKPRTDEPVSANPSAFAEPVSANPNGKLPKTSFRSAEPVSSLISKPYPCADFGGQIPDGNGPQVASGDFEPFNEERLRRDALALIKQRGRGSQVRLATAAGINEGAFSTFLRHRISLPPASLARLNRALNQVAA